MSVPRVPPHPIDQLTGTELARYRTQLETALAAAKAGTADHTLITRRLAEVTSQQTERTSARMGNAYTEVYARFAAEL